MQADKLPTYGGQAVIEGVMMRGAQSVAIAMRAPDKKIIIHTEDLGGIYTSRLAKIPFLRGLVLLWDALGLGMRALTLSANLQSGEEEQIEGPALYFTLGLALIIAVGLFFLLPAAIGGWMEQEQFLEWNAWAGNLVEGFARLLILIGYIWVIGWLPDVKRVFAYHGAEHKTINAFEADAPLTPESVSAFPLDHPRCGTAFLLTVVVISVLLFAFLSPLPWLWRLTWRVLLIPVLAGLAYEYIRWTANHRDSPWVRWMTQPNLVLQRLTTREPTTDMLEVAIAAFQALRDKEQRFST
jgi:uncharacterized protein YqhQ